MNSVVPAPLAKLRSSSPGTMYLNEHQKMSPLQNQPVARADVTSSAWAEGLQHEDKRLGFAMPFDEPLYA